VLLGSVFLTKKGLSNTSVPIQFLFQLLHERERENNNNNNNNIYCIFKRKYATVTDTKYCKVMNTLTL
jgi:hypothetical protein